MNRNSPVMARIFKEEGKLEIWKQKTTGRYDMIASYDICKWSGKLGPEVRRRRPPGAGRLLHRSPHADESEVELSPRLQHRLSQHL